ncbi:MAG TPA: hypothetical protein VIM44_06335, partial [Rariglobus sp.]
ANRRNHDLWLVASHPGDERYKSIVQQAMVHVTPTKTGTPQRITFPAIADVTVDKTLAAPAPIALAATSDAGVPVAYYVREGPAEIDGSTLRFTAIPPRSKFPINVTVVAWQFGRATEPKLQTADRVERTFRLRLPDATR